MTSEPARIFPFFPRFDKPGSCRPSLPPTCNPRWRSGAWLSRRSAPVPVPPMPAMTP